MQNFITHYLVISHFKIMKFNTSELGDMNMDSAILPALELP